MLIRDMLTEIHREQTLRRIVFTKLITQGRLSPAEATERLERLEATADLLRALIRLGKPSLDHIIKGGV